MRQPDIGATTNSVVEGGVVAVTVAVLQQTVLAMIPFALPALFLIALDCNFGIKASRIRYQKYKRPEDEVKFPKFLRRTVGKIIEFACWLIVASSMSIAFKKEWIQWTILGAIYLNEIVSIVGNYLYTRGVEFDFLEFLKKVFVFVGRWIGSKIGIVTDDVTFDDVLKPVRHGKGKKTKPATKR